MSLPRLLRVSPGILSSYSSAGLCIFFAALLSIGVMGCGGGSGSDGGDSGGSDEKVEMAKEDAEEAKAEAQAMGCPKYSPKEWKKALASLEKAEDKYTDGSKAATRMFKSAKGAFKNAMKKAEKNKEKFEDAEKYKNNYLALKKKAKEAKIDERYPEDWSDAEKYLEKGDEQIEKARFSQARNQYKYAIAQLEDKLEQIKRDDALMAKALESKKEMEEHKQNAVKVGADKTSISNFEMGRNQEKEANDKYNEGKYQDSIWSYNGAKDWYVTAIDDHNAQEVARKYQEDLDKQAERGPDDSMEAPDIDDIDIPDLNGGDDEDGYDTDITSNLDRLFHCETDYKNGIIDLYYQFGVDFQKDVTAYGVRTTGKKRTLIFEGREGVGVFSGDKPEDEELDEVDPEDIISYTFAGNTRGTLIVNCGMKDGMQIEFDMRYQLVLADQPAFRVLVNSSKKGKNYYGTEFGCWAIVGESKRAMKRELHKDKTYRVSPQNWIDRKRDYHYKLIYRKESEDEKGTFVIFMDDEEMFRKKFDKYRKGFPGFQWNNVKFIVKNLRIKGRLDDEWAVERLKELQDLPPPVEKEDLDF